MAVKAGCLWNDHDENHLLVGCVIPRSTAAGRSISIWSIHWASEQECFTPALPLCPFPQLTRNRRRDPRQRDC